MEEFAMLEISGGDTGLTTLFADNGAPLLRRLTIRSSLTRGVPFYHGLYPYENFDTP